MASLGMIYLVTISMSGSQPPGRYRYTLIERKNVCFYTHFYRPRRCLRPERPVLRLRVLEEWESIIP